MVCINGKLWKCHELSMMTFRPNEYSTKESNEIILHKEDDKLDFRPFRLRIGTPSNNITDAHDNGKYDGTKSARQPVLSYINGEFEKDHESINAAARYLREIYKKASISCVYRALHKGSIAYGRTWKFM
ncbi:hypothetical protein ATCVTN60342_514L [Acanthocystis turfacea Chlorella virus TN603.4.2]|nr:hypothetical protein ATCVTN60342_514L [Acanthocystis turfacea Chlorella virus TN603.4.2]